MGQEKGCTISRKGKHLNREDRIKIEGLLKRNHLKGSLKDTEFCHCERTRSNLSNDFKGIASVVSLPRNDNAKIIAKSILNFFKCQSPDLLCKMRHFILQFITIFKKKEYCLLEK